MPVSFALGWYEKAPYRGCVVQYGPSLEVGSLWPDARRPECPFTFFYSLFGTSFDWPFIIYCGSTISDLTYGLTPVVQNILLPLTVFTTTVSPYTLMNVKGPYQNFFVLQHTKTGDHAGSLRSACDFSAAFCPLLCLEPNATRILACILLTSVIARPIYSV